MRYTTLGRTGLRVSVAGLGCGGFSRLGLGTGQSAEHAAGLVRQALDLGVNLIDTAAAYGTEDVVGTALRQVPRDSVVVCTKASKPSGDATFSADKVVASLDASLKRLGLDYVDVFQLHAVPPAAYDHVRDMVVPALLRQRDKGKFRFLGITETAPNDPRAKDAQPSGPGRLLGYRDGSVSPDAPSCAHAGLSTHDRKSNRHVNDVRGTGNFCAPWSVSRDDAELGGGRSGSAMAGGNR